MGSDSGGLRDAAHLPDGAILHVDARASHAVLVLRASVGRRQLHRAVSRTIGNDRYVSDLQYGGYTRGSGASYCEGYVSGLPIPGLHPDDAASFADKQDAPAGAAGLIHTRTLALKEAAGDWLELECDIRLVRSSRSGRGQRDPAATSRGKQHGASHDLNVPGARKRLN